MSTKEGGAPAPEGGRNPDPKRDSNKDALKQSGGVSTGSAYAETLDDNARTLADPRKPTTSEASADFRMESQSLGETVEMTRSSFSSADGNQPTVDPGSAGSDEDGSKVTIAFSGSSAGGPSAKGDGKAAVDQIVPGYEILSELGRGGMGVVYKARQIALGRTVALKMVLAGAHASADQLLRFNTEAQAIAHLQHPDMVQIYDIGECNGLPYFSLEFVDGGCLTEKIGGRPMLPRDAAEMLLFLAGAMQAAHEKGIIHRDLKPANVLLTKVGRPKITDFGLAKRLEGDSQQTRSGAIMGTPSYMAPEQAWGQTHEIGPLADQYALGAILYEMLVGRPPFQGATPLDTLDLARNTEPVPPTRLQPKVPIDLETICLKCLQKDSRKRYQNCGELADDVQRFLDGEPILARPISAPERVWRWCLRNPRVAALTVGIAASLLIIAVGSATAAVSLNKKNFELEEKRRIAVSAQAAEKIAKQEAIRKQKEAETAKAAEAEQKRIAVDQKEKAELIAKLALEQTNRSLNSLRLLSVLAIMRLKNITGTAEVRAELLNTAERELKDVMEKLNEVANKASEYNVMDRRLTEQTLVGIYLKMGQAFEDMGRLDEAGKQYAKMDERAEALFAKLPNDPEAKQALAYSKCALGDFLLTRAGKVREAAAQYDRALKLRRELLDFESTDARKRDLAQVLGMQGRLNLMNGNPPKALEYYEEERELRDSMSAEFQQGLEIRRELSGLCEKLGELYIRLRQPIKGREAYDRSLEIREQLALETSGDANTLQTTQRDVLLSVNQIGVMSLLQWNDPATAKVYFLRALNGFEKQSKADGGTPLSKSDLSLTHYFVATACLKTGDRKEADDHYRKCLEIRRELANQAKGGDLRMPKINLMVALGRCGEHEEASKIAAWLIEKPPQDAHDYFQAACGFALSAGGIARDRPKENWSTEEAALIRKYTDSALESLRKGAKAGYRDIVELEQDPDLDPIRTDPGFVKLLQEFRGDEAAAKK